MLKKQMKVGLEILSPNDFVWKVIKKYSLNLFLIKRIEDELTYMLPEKEFYLWELYKKETKP